MAQIRQFKRLGKAVVRNLREQGPLFTIKKVFYKLYQLTFASRPQVVYSESSYFIELQNSSKKSYQHRGYEAKPRQDFTTKVICFYLPQFHPIAENNKFWEVGFTEWTNVSKSFPLFANHYQPRYPADLGFYDLRLTATLEKQAELARNYGVHGFCFHYYWFSGRKVMDTPIELLFKNKQIDINFAICWANENWTRRWDGNEDDLLLQQLHHEDDYLNFIKDVAPNFADPRYIRVNNKPLLVIYRAELLKDAKKAAEVWRSHARSLGYDDLHLVLSESFGPREASDYGFDASVDFAPNQFQAKEVSKQLHFYSKDYQGHVYDYPSLRTLSSQRKKTNAYSSLCLAWDNSARKGSRSTVFHNYSPAAFGRWLRQLIASQPLNDLVFVNAWNEWAEGTYLEPDRRYGFAALNEVYNALTHQSLGKQEAASSERKVILLLHDAHFHGAQLLALKMVMSLRQHFQYDVIVICKEDGALLSEFANGAEVYLANDISPETIQDFYQRGFQKVLANSAASGDLLKLFSNAPFQIVSLIHEMPDIIRSHGIEKGLQLMFEKSKAVVFPNNTVKAALTGKFGSPQQKSLVLSQGLFNPAPYAQSALANPFSSDKVILGIGFGDHRKGFDHFVRAAHYAWKHQLNLHYTWVGNLETGCAQEVSALMADCQGKTLSVLAPDRALSKYYLAAQAFFLSSREDPNPSVALEAAAHGLPLLAYKNSGGAASLIEKHHLGQVATTLDPQTINEHFLKILQDRETYVKACKDFSQRGLSGMNQYIHQLLNELGDSWAKVSVILPNYNYRPYLRERLESILQQSYPVWEIIILDDGSTDGSDPELRRLIDKHPLVKFIYLPSEKNSGSPFVQWKKGLDAITGDFLWIAEADDLSEPEFLAQAMQMLADTSVGLAYTQSKRINEQGAITHEDYLFYTQEISTTKWQNSYVTDGRQEIREALSQKNTIPNVSAVVFRRESLPEDLSFLNKYRYAGDWLLYVSVLMKSRAAFCKIPLNRHRHHSHSATFSGLSRDQEAFDREKSLVRHFCQENS